MIWDPESANPAVGSFLPMLRWAVAETDGPILELGGGYFSTPYLHEVAKTEGRPVFTYEYDLAWECELRARFLSDLHGLVMDIRDLPDLPWSVVLIDCEGWAREAFFDIFAPFAGITVLHDSQDPWVPEIALSRFRYRIDDGGEPQTTLVSNTVDVREYQP